MPGPMIMLVRSWPRLSQTFIVNEALALERRGVELTIVSLVHSGERLRQPQVADLAAPVHYLDGRSRRERWARVADHAAAFAAAPIRYVAALLFALRRPGLAAGYATCSTLVCFGHAVRISRLAARLGRPGAAPVLHAHFAHDPALVAMLAHRLCGLPYSITAHARDLYQVPPASLTTRLAAATAVVTCCQANADYLAETVPAGLRPPVHVIHHGVELQRFTPRADPAGVAVTLVTVGRLVAKKGFTDLLRACAQAAAAGHAFSCQLYGDGPLREDLQRLTAELGLADRVTFHGERDRDEILRALATADLFALTPVVTDDGDRDGIPNVLVEAMACAVPVVATAAGGVTELVQHEVNGLVARPGDVDGIARQLERLLADPVLRQRLGAAGRRTVEADYDVDEAARRLSAILRHELAEPVAVPR